MSLRRLVTRSNGLFLSNGLRPSFKSSLPLTLRQTRQAHYVPLIGGNQAEDQQLQKNGVPGLFTPEAFDVAWTQYQHFMVDRLNTILANDQIRAQWRLKDLLIATARDPNLAPTFNYASMAHNNHFFFKGLSRTETEVPDTLEGHLVSSFGSISALRDTLLSTAAGMFGPGFVWLVQDDRPQPQHPATANSSSISSGTSREQIHFRILVTYLAGTPYPGAHTRQQGVDMNVQNLQSAEDFNRHSRVQNDIGSFGRMSRSARGMDGISMNTTGYDDGGDVRRFGGADITPVLCVNTWQHTYMHDYGVAGKREFLARWWERINWETVRANCIERQKHDLFH